MDLQSSLYQPNSRLVFYQDPTGLCFMPDYSSGYENLRRFFWEQTFPNELRNFIKTMKLKKIKIIYRSCYQNNFSRCSKIIQIFIIYNDMTSFIYLSIIINKIYFSKSLQYQQIWSCCVHSEMTWLCHDLFFSWVTSLNLIE